MTSKTAEKLIRNNLKCLRGDNISAIRSRRHETVLRIEDGGSFERTKLFEFLSRKKLRPDGTEASVLLQKTLPPMSSSSLNYFVMQYLFNTKNQVNFDPIGALSHFVVPGLAESSESPLEVKGQSNQGQGGEETSAGKITVSSSISSLGSSNPRLEILKMRAAQRLTNVGSKDTPQHEEAAVTSIHSPE